MGVRVGLTTRHMKKLFGVLELFYSECSCGVITLQTGHLKNSFALYNLYLNKLDLKTKLKPCEKAFEICMTDKGLVSQL